MGLQPGLASEAQLRFFAKIRAGRCGQLWKLSQLWMVGEEGGNQAFKGGARSPGETLQCGGEARP